MRLRYLYLYLTSLSILPGGFPTRQLKLLEPVFTVVSADNKMNVEKHIVSIFLI
jgi:hypothetical protein